MTELWRISVSNRSPQPCKGCALPDELIPHLVVESQFPHALETRLHDSISAAHYSLMLYRTIVPHSPRLISAQPRCAHLDYVLLAYITANEMSTVTTVHVRGIEPLPETISTATLSRMVTVCSDSNR